MRPLKRHTILLLVYTTITFFVVGHHTRRHSSGQAAFSRLGHDFTKSQKDARDILQVKAQTGTTAILHCNINAGPDVPIYWVKQAPDSPIIITDNKVIITDRRFHISEEDSTLHIHLTKPEDAGLYVCRTGEDEAKSKKQYVKLTLQEAYAEILLPLGQKNISVKVGSPLRLSCLLHNLLEQPSYIFWYRGDRMINYDLTGGAAVRIGHKGSELIIPSAQPSDAGDYMCVPSNARQASVYVNVTIPKRQQYAARQTSGNDNSKFAWMTCFVYTLLMIMNC